MTQNETPAKAPTDAEFLTGYEQHLADSAVALLASLPKRRVRTRKVAK